MLWLTNSNLRIFGWTDILEDWNYTLAPSHHVTAVIENLRAATNPNGVHSPSLGQFLTYLNYEQDGIKWFLHECLANRWLWNDIRIDYVRGLVDEIENLDSHFPEFPGSPSCTVREFVNSNLENYELDYVQMMPPLAPMRSSCCASASACAARSSRRSCCAPSSVAAAPAPAQQAVPAQAQAQATPLRPTSATVGSPPPIRRRISSYWTDSEEFDTLSGRLAAAAAEAADAAAEAAAAAEAEAEVAAAAAKAKRNSLSIMVRLLRSDSAKDDDVIHINPSGDNYTVRYTDRQNDSKLKMRYLDYDGVLEYLSNFLRLVSVDELPFKSVQFSLPALPTVVVKPGNLTSQTRDLVYDSVEMVLKSWPVGFC